MLYQMVVEKLREVTPSAKDMLLFDVCCGTGTIGLTCLQAGAVGKVVGVDISEPGTYIFMRERYASDHCDSQCCCLY